jgi:hypothetical protein
MKRPGPAMARVVTALAVSTMLLGACAASDGTHATFPSTTLGPSIPVTAAVDIGLTKAAIVSALAARQLTMSEVQTPYRPAESPLMASAPKQVYQVLLQADPDKGFIEVYDFVGPAAAASAATEQQQYLATGSGRVQTPQGTIHVIRLVGNTVVLYDWLPAAAADTAAPDIQAALETVGIGYQVAN